MNARDNCPICSPPRPMSSKQGVVAATPRPVTASTPPRTILENAPQQACLLRRAQIRVLQFVSPILQVGLDVAKEIFARVCLRVVGGHPHDLDAESVTDSLDLVVVC